MARKELDRGSQYHVLASGLVSNQVIKYPTVTYQLASYLTQNDLVSRGKEEIKILQSFLPHFMQRTIQLNISKSNVPIYIQSRVQGAEPLTSKVINTNDDQNLLETFAQGVVSMHTETGYLLDLFGLSNIIPVITHYLIDDTFWAMPNIHHIPTNVGLKRIAITDFGLFQTRVEQGNSLDAVASMILHSLTAQTLTRLHARLI